MVGLIETIVKPLVDEPDAVSVEEEVQSRTVVYRLTVSKNDIGKVIGKQGRIARAIRSVVYAAGTRSSKRIQLEIND
ncbi:KH domain-containing protein [Bacillus mangrovi]|uniref:RNA-binding protein KhpA n=1 Tax=Metabacillus mangrovi TaxID=1491830 RepID=A0A7X2S3U0_9BACI|nr:KH domain-containing protein [Metabacillus mangrovi]MTH52718.1 KH domain-containing protein [Metabacillus mangrovi]